MFTDNKTSETETRDKIPFAIATRKIKYLGINLTKEVKDLYSENYKTLKKEIKKDTNKWGIYHIHGLIIKIIKMSIPPKAINRFDAIPITIPRSYFTDLEQIFQKYIWKQ